MHTMKRPLSALLPLLIALPVLSSCAKPAEPRTEFVLGTVCTVNLYEKGTDAIYNEIFARLRRLEDILSANRDDTNLAAINAGAGIRPVKAEPETLEILDEGLRFAEISGGKLDPTVGPLVKTWNIGTEYAAVPSSDALRAAVRLIDWKKVRIDRTAGTVYLEEPGMKLDLGAIAKGYAADEAARIIKKRGIKRAIVDLGGNILAVGEKAPGKPWKIGIRNPETEQGGSVLSMEINDSAVVTSGVYERFFIENGRRYHHILDPFTGFPAENGLLSVSIVTARSIDADALSTTTFLLGLDKGMRLVNSMDGVEAVFIDSSKKVRVSAGLLGKVAILEDGYAMAE